MSTLSNLLQIKRSTCLWDGCNKNFHSKNACFIHVKQVHIKADTTLCKWKNCTAELNTKSNMTNHMHKHIPKIRDVCYVCEKPYKWTGDYKKHLKTHSEAEIKFNEAAGLLLDNLLSEL